MICIEDWMMIQHLHQQGVPKARIARELGVDRKTVDKAVSTEKFPTQTRRERGSILDPYKDYIKQRVSKYDLTATRILREIQQRGYPGSYTIVKDYLRQLNGEKPKPAYVRFETEPGEQAQVDWSDFGWLQTDGSRIKLWCFSMVLGYSRMLYIQFMFLNPELSGPSQNLVHLGQAHIHAFAALGGVTDTILYDNMTTVVLSREGGQIRWNPRFMDFAAYYGFVPKLCLPGRKETKGKVERPFSYIRSSFFNGCSFGSLSELNERAASWLAQVANVRIHATTKAVPLDRLDEERLRPLRHGDYVLKQTERRKSSKDCFISFEGNRYSIPHQYSCRELTVTITGEQLEISYDDDLIATHPVSYQKGQMISNPKHFLGIPKPAYPSGIRGLRELFLAHFPQANPFLDGLVGAKYGNARYHLLQILDPLDDYPKPLVASAIERATHYGAFECQAIRNICHQSQLPKQLPDESVLASAILDRLLHHSTLFNIRGQSFRLRQRQQAIDQQTIGPSDNSPTDV